MHCGDLNCDQDQIGLIFGKTGIHTWSGVDARLRGGVNFSVIPR